MKVESFQALLARVQSLTEAQLDELVLWVENRRSKTKALRVLESAWGAPKCGHCASSKVVKNGHSRGLQRTAAAPAARPSTPPRARRWLGFTARSASSSGASAWPKA